MKLILTILLLLVPVFGKCAQQTIEATDPLNTFRTKANDNFTELYYKSIPIVTNAADLADLPISNTNAFCSDYFNNGMFTVRNNALLVLLTNNTTVIRSTVNSNWYWVKAFDSDSASVAWFGAVPNDGVDDTIAIKEAIKMTMVSPIKTLVFPAGDYNIHFDSTNQTYGYLFGLSSGVKLVASGGARLILDNTNLASYNAIFAPATNVLPVANVTISGLSFLDQNLNATAIRLIVPPSWVSLPAYNTMTNVVIENVSIAGFRYGIDAYNNMGNTTNRYLNDLKIINSSFENNLTSIRVDANLVNIANSSFLGATVGYDEGAVIDIAGGRNVSISSCVFEGRNNTSGSIVVRNVASITNGVDNITVANCVMNNTSGWGVKVYCETNENVFGISGVTITGNRMKGSDGVNVTSEGTDGVISDLTIGNNSFNVQNIGINIIGSSTVKATNINLICNSITAPGEIYTAKIMDCSVVNMIGNTIFCYGDTFFPIPPGPFEYPRQLIHAEALENANITGNIFLDKTTTLAAYTMARFTNIVDGMMADNQFYTKDGRSIQLDCFTNVNYFMNGQSIAGSSSFIMPGGSTYFTLPMPLGGTGTNSLTGVVQGFGSNALSVATGTSNYVVRWDGTEHALTTNSSIWDDGGHVGIGWLIADLTNQQAQVAISGGLNVGTNTAVAAGNINLTGNLTIGGSFTATNLYVKQSTFNPLATNWYRIIQGTVIDSGLIRIRAEGSLSYQRSEMLVAYNVPSYTGIPEITVLTGNSAIENPIKAIRGSTTGGASACYLDLYCDPAGSTNWNIYCDFQGRKMDGVLANPVGSVAAGGTVERIVYLSDFEGFKASSIYANKLNVNYSTNRPEIAAINGDLVLASNAVLEAKLFLGYTNGGRLAVNGGVSIGATNDPGLGGLVVTNFIRLSNDWSEVILTTNRFSFHSSSNYPFALQAGFGDTNVYAIFSYATNSSVKPTIFAPVNLNVYNSGGLRIGTLEPPTNNTLHVYGWTELHSSPEFASIGKANATNSMWLGGYLQQFRQEASDNDASGFIANGIYDGALNLVGKGSGTTNRSVTVYDSMSIPYGGFTVGAASTGQNIGEIYATDRVKSRYAFMVTTPDIGTVTRFVYTNGAALGGKMLQLQQDPTDNVNSGFIYNGLSGTTLEIAGKGATTTNRYVEIYDCVAIPNGGLYLGGSFAGAPYGGIWATNTIEATAGFKAGSSHLPGISTNMVFVSTNMAGGLITNTVNITGGLITGWTQ